MFLCAKGDILLYEHPELHLNFTIDTSTKEAIIGNTIYQEDEDHCNAVCSKNEPADYWYNLDIPSTITCENFAYVHKTYYDSYGYLRHTWDIVNINKETYTVTAVASKAFYKSPRRVNIQTIKLPETIREIGEGAFSWCIYLRSINIPSQVTVIKSSTFWYCKNMVKFVLPENIETIETSAFSDCENLEEINIPGKCVSIQNNAFTWCPKLHKLTIEDGIEPLNVGFLYVLGLNDGRLEPKEHHRPLFADSPIDTVYLGRNIKYPHTSNNVPLSPFKEKLTYSSYGSYYYNSSGSIKSLTFGETVTEIADSLFYDVGLNCELVLPNNLRRIGDGAFYWDMGNYITPRKIEIPASVEYIGKYAFRENYLSEVIFHDGLKTIGDYAFYDNKLSSLTIPATVTSYGINPFGKNNIESLSLADGLKTMCSISDAKIVELTIPESMENTGASFGNSLRFVYCKPTTPPEGIIGSAVIYVPAGTGGLYRESGWRNIVDPADNQLTINVKKEGTLYSRILAQDFQVSDIYRLKLKGTLNDDDWATINNMSSLYDLDLSELPLEELPSGFFQNKKNLNKITFPNTLKNIEENAFAGCIHLGGIVNIPAGCTSIGNRAFYQLNIGGVCLNGNTNIHDEVFMNCSFLKEVTLAPECVVGANAFVSTVIEELNIPANVTIGNNAFNISTLKKVTFNGGGQEIGNNVFAKSVEKYTFNGIVKSIGSFASGIDVDVNDIHTWCNIPFSNPVTINHLSINGEEANNIVIPNDVKSLRNYIFYECPTIQSIKISDGIKEIPERAFKGCANLSTVSLPAKLEIIGDSAFSGCVCLHEIVLPPEVRTLERYSFAGCEKLSQIEMPSALTIINDGAFAKCALLNNVQLPDNLLIIGDSVFASCTTLEEIDLPQSVTSIGVCVFSGCESLALVVAHWNNPITVNNKKVNCLLYVPIGTSQKYVNAGWNFSTMKERGTLTVIATGDGNVSYDSESVNNSKKHFYFKPYQDFNIQIVPNSGFKIMKATLNGENIIPEISEGEFVLEEPEEDVELCVIFDDASIEQGDVNADRVLNSTDATGIANYILKRASLQFHDYWADMNGDGVIDITDIIILISIYMSR